MKYSLCTVAMTLSMFNRLDSGWERGLQAALSLACAGLCDTSRSLSGERGGQDRWAEPHLCFH